MNSQYIFLVCISKLHLYYYDLFRINITNQSLGEMTYLTSINRDSYLKTILLDDVFYIYSPQQITIYYINLNISHGIQAQCNMTSFQPYVYQNSNYSFYANIYTCKDEGILYYQLGNSYQGEQISFILPQHIQLKDYIHFESQIEGLLIVSQHKNQIAIMCFTNQLSIIIRLNYMVNERNFSLSTLAFNRLLYYSPPLVPNNSFQFKDAIISSDLVFVNYLNENNYSAINILYNISGLDLIGGYLEYPILPSANISNFFAYYQNILTFNSSYGFIYTKLQNYLISSLKVEIHLQNQQTQCKLTAFNLVNNVTANYTFNFDQQIVFGFEYAFLAFFIIFFISALTFLWFKTKNQKEQFGLEEFEELGIDTYQ
ncbi:unnamed protein product (macronuclear) [Paramecium tetraurelia]|uniref:Transmembrane protein n=1 Tax=Paramecium tetraurelia TaxID=5888 RepID=A0CSP6_PARTE|nr:uncharacterized protein GSPATT00010085001 [Paramecium tetraurelia]CAK73813.1 unnamed protein product [Paramecium tetraurelia]|eukprot:XP_001441210.1 hypothetical protein (macronuclear) [Paramecium tetraurelia strain d4-2]